MDAEEVDKIKSQFTYIGENVLINSESDTPKEKRVSGYSFHVCNVCGAIVAAKITTDTGFYIRNYSYLIQHISYHLPKRGKK